MIILSEQTVEEVLRSEITTDQGVTVFPRKLLVTLDQISYDAMFDEITSFKTEVKKQYGSELTVVVYKDTYHQTIEKDETWQSDRTSKSKWVTTYSIYLVKKG
jgi:hypothetical protein